MCVSIKGKTCLSADECPIPDSAASTVHPSSQLYVYEGRAESSCMDEQGERVPGARPREACPLLQLTGPLQEDSEGVHRAC